MNINRAALAALACVTLAGCGGGLSAPRTVPTSGTVLFKGKPAEGVRVTFHPKFHMVFTPNGVTGKDGRFNLSTAAPMDGAPRGEYSVTFELMRSGPDKRGLDSEFDAWKGKYANVETAPKVTVSSSTATLDPFRLD